MNKTEFNLLVENQDTSVLASNYKTQVYFSCATIMKIMASGPITPWEIDGKTVETMSDFTFLGSKSRQIVTASVKLKDAYSLEGKL